MPKILLPKVGLLVYILSAHLQTIANILPIFLSAFLPTDARKRVFYNRNTDSSMNNGNLHPIYLQEV